MIYKLPKKTKAHAKSAHFNPPHLHFDAGGDATRTSRSFLMSKNRVPRVIFTARHCASAILLCLYVCICLRPSQAGIVYKRL